MSRYFYSILMLLYKKYNEDDTCACTPNRV